MRYPGEENKSDSINISSAGNNSQLLGAFSSSSTSASSQEQDDSTVGGIGGGNGTQIATISEHVLFGNNNGQNSFLYLYYSESSNSKRPYTTGGGIDSIKGINKMGSSSQQQNTWNDLSGGMKKSGGGRGSAGLSALSYGVNDGDEYEFDEKKMQMRSASGGSKTVKYDATPYPVYLSPVEGSPTFTPSSPEKSSKTQSGKEKNGRDRLDSITGGFFDEEDWDRIYSVPDVDSRYIFSPEPPNLPKSAGRGGSREGSSRLQVKRSGGNNSLKVTKPSPASSASSLRNMKAHQSQHSRAGSRRVRVTPESSMKGSVQGRNRQSSMKKWSSTSSVQSKKRSPLGSSTPSTKSTGKGNQVNQHGVTHHHHQPPSGQNDVGHHGGSATTGDGIDQIYFRNGIGAFFGTPASKRISQIHEPTPEEMYNQEMGGWRSRLTTTATIFAATLFILSCASLLFVFPILVDPILVGLEAQFSENPVTCRTTNFRNGSSPLECAIPSCREGCTLDLFSCIFVDVEYKIASNDIPQIKPKPANNTFRDSTRNSSSTNNNFETSLLEDGHSTRSAILLININGCGYESCSDFQRKFAPLHTEFPCHYSQQNESIVVPHYSRHTEIIHLTLAVCVPVGVALTSGVSLYLLVRYNSSLKASIYKKYAARKKELRAKRKKLKEAEEEEELEEDATSISELEPQEHYEKREDKPMQNGNSKIGIESSHLLTSTQM